MIAKMIWLKGSIAKGLYPAVAVYTGKKHIGRDHLILRVSAATYNDDPWQVRMDMNEIIRRINGEDYDDSVQTTSVPSPGRNVA